jgi:hypothetical protein
MLTGNQSPCLAGAFYGFSAKVVVVAENMKNA